MTNFYTTKETDKDGNILATSGKIDIDLTKYSPEIQELIKDILKIMGYEQ